MKIDVRVGNGPIQPSFYRAHCLVAPLTNQWIRLEGKLKLIGKFHFVIHGLGYQIGP